MNCKVSQHTHANIRGPKNSKFEICLVANALHSEPSSYTDYFQDLAILLSSELAMSQETAVVLGDVKEKLGVRWWAYV